LTGIQTHETIITADQIHAANMTVICVVQGAEIGLSGILLFQVRTKFYLYLCFCVCVYVIVYPFGLDKRIRSLQKGNRKWNFPFRCLLKCLILLLQLAEQNVREVRSGTKLTLASSQGQGPCNNTVRAEWWVVSRDLKWSGWRWRDMRINPQVEDTTSLTLESCCYLSFKQKFLSFNISCILK
jgi:hypothetical protein